MSTSTFFCIMQYKNFIFNSSDKITRMRSYMVGSRIQGVFAWKESQQPDSQSKPENAPPRALGSRRLIWYTLLESKIASRWHSGLSPWWGPAVLAGTSSCNLYPQLLSFAVLVCSRMARRRTTTPSKYLMFGDQQVNALRKREVKWQKFSKIHASSMTEVFQSPRFLYSLYVKVLRRQNFSIPRTCSARQESSKAWLQLFLVPFSWAVGSGLPFCTCCELVLVPH